MDDLGPVLLAQLGRNVLGALALDGLHGLHRARCEPAPALEHACDAREGARVAAHRADLERQVEHEGDGREQQGLRGEWTRAGQPSGHARRLRRANERRTRLYGAGGGGLNWRPATVSLAWRCCAGAGAAVVLAAVAGELNLWLAEAGTSTSSEGTCW